MTDRLDHLFSSCPGLVAIEGERVVGYLGWFTLDDFRGTGRRAAYCPVWGHATVQRDRDQIYHLLYRHAAEQWTSAGCQTHAITILAHDQDALRAFHLNGFGVTVIDAVRHAAPAAQESSVSHEPGQDLAVRRACQSDLDTLTALEAEHLEHYSRPPVLMVESDLDLGQVRDSLHSTWLAVRGDEAVGFLRFEPQVCGASDLVVSQTSTAISGAYVRPAHRGRGVATALLNTALDEYAQAGLTHCSVDFESFNPEARAFWMRSFTPFCLSVIRHPESVLTTVVR